MKKAVVYIFFTIVVGMTLSNSMFDGNGIRKVVYAIEQYSIVITNEWINNGSIGQLGFIQPKLGITREELRSIRGKPLATGFYEGGEYYQYEDVTFFVNPETNITVAVAMDLSNEKVTNKEIQMILGKPDVSEENKMEDVWINEYRLGKYSLIFESKDDKSTTPVDMVWLRER